MPPSPSRRSTRKRDVPGNSLVSSALAPAPISTLVAARNVDRHAADGRDATGSLLADAHGEASLAQGRSTLREPVRLDGDQRRSDAADAAQPGQPTCS